MDAYDGYCISKGVKPAGGGVKPSVDDVQRWKAMMGEASHD